MRLLDRYLLRELLVPFAYCLGGFLLFWIFFDLFAELGNFQRKKLHGLDIAQYYLVITPDFLTVVVPVALLLALLYTLTNHARHNELTAIRAAGQSLWRICLPYLAVGLSLSVVNFAIGEFWAPTSADRAERIKSKRTPTSSGLAAGMMSAYGLANAREGRTWVTGEYDPKTSEMFNPLVISAMPDGSQRWLIAQRALRTNGLWTFFDAREYRADGGSNSILAPTIQSNILVMPQFHETPAEIESEIKISRALSLRTRNRADLPIFQILDYLRLHPNPEEAISRLLRTKLQGRLAAPWTCLVVVLIAIPFGAASGRRNVFVGVASSILICFIFFVLQQLGLALGSGGYLPPWLAAWAPNLAFGLVGLAMTTRVR
jgi:lipopolysaccharide export system permease protein